MVTTIFYILFTKYCPQIKDNLLIKRLAYSVIIEGFYFANTSTYITIVTRLCFNISVIVHFEFASALYSYFPPMRLHCK